MVTLKTDTKSNTPPAMTELLAERL